MLAVILSIIGSALLIIANMGDQKEVTWDKLMLLIAGFWCLIFAIDLAVLS